MGTAIRDVELSCAVCGCDMGIGKIDPAPLELVIQAWGAIHANHAPEQVHEWLETIVEDKATFREEMRAPADDSPWSTPG